MFTLARASLQFVPSLRSDRKQLRSVHLKDFLLIPSTKQLHRKPMDLYYLPGSAPCRAVQMVGAAVGANFNLKLLNLMTGEHLQPEFLKINPQHTIPTLVDGDFKLWESRAIMIYLVEKYGKDNLFPKDPKTRAVVNQRLYFDMGTLYQKFADYYYPQVFAKAPADPEKFKAIETAMGFFETFLKDSKYAAGNELTVADISLVATISSYDVAGFDLSKYPAIAKWYDLCKTTVPGYSINEAGMKEFAKFFNH